MRQIEDNQDDTDEVGIAVYDVKLQTANLCAPISNYIDAPAQLALSRHCAQLQHYDLPSPITPSPDSALPSWTAFPFAIYIC